MRFLFFKHFFIRKTAVQFVQFRSNSTSTAITFDMLRSYQKECIKTTLREYKEGHNRQIVSLPVGSGKTVIMSNLIPLIPSPTHKATKVLLLAHRTELLDQAHNQISKYNPSLVVQVEQGKRRVNIDDADVVIASVPTLGRANSARIELFDPSLFKAILIDEAHHAVADTYKRILDYFGINDAGCDKLLWGCTATVKRHDGLGLNTVFDRITYHVGFIDMIQQGYLSRMRVTTINTQVDLDAVRKTNIDFVQKDLAHAINTQARNDVIVSSWNKYAHQQGRKSTLVFAVDIAHTIELCNTFIDAGIPAQCITSKSNPIERHAILNDFRNGKIPVLVNCAILTEGTDIPCVDCILLARPTRSTTLFQQMFGRGLRLFPGKENCLVIDFVDNFKRTGTDGLITVPTLLGLDATKMVEDKDLLELEEKAEKENQENEQSEQEYPEEYDPDHVKISITEYDNLEELMADLSTSQEVRNASTNGWVDIGKDKCALHVMSKGYLVLQKSEKNDIWTGTFRYENSGKDFFAKSYPIPLEASDLPAALRAADTWIHKRFSATNKSLIYQMRRSAPFRKDNMTDAQKKALSRYKIETPNDLTKGQAMDLLTKLKFGQLNIWRTQFKLDAKQKQLQKKKSERALLSRHNQQQPTEIY